MTSPRPPGRPALDVALAVLALAADVLAALAVMVVTAARGLGRGAPQGPGPYPADWAPVWWFAGLTALVAVTGRVLWRRGLRAAAWTQLGAAGLLAVVTVVTVVASVAAAGRG
ncbi:hypothetical protein [Streptomyces sp. NPDC058486]|uniref:hypothetical protein n=1 Tax=unclassified Streptomyces TaxID=2593676 RepID=UPI003650E7DB